MKVYTEKPAEKAADLTDAKTATVPDRPKPVLLPAHVPSRLIIEGVYPEIDGGRFPIKRTVGEQVEVAADIFADGHDTLAAVVRYRRVGQSFQLDKEAGQAGKPDLRGDWQEVPMAELGNDRWLGRFQVTDLGRYEYTLEAWIDHFGGFRPGPSWPGCIGNWVPPCSTSPTIKKRR